MGDHSVTCVKRQMLKGLVVLALALAIDATSLYEQLEALYSKSLVVPESEFVEESCVLCPAVMLECGPGGTVVPGTCQSCSYCKYQTCQPSLCGCPPGTTTESTMDRHGCPTCHCEPQRPPTCDICVHEFESNGGCDAWKAKDFEKLEAAIPPGCDPCGDAAAAHCKIKPTLPGECEPCKAAVASKFKAVIAHMKQAMQQHFEEAKAKHEHQMEMIEAKLAAFKADISAKHAKMAEYAHKEAGDIKALAFKDKEICMKAAREARKDMAAEFAKERALLRRYAWFERSAVMAASCEDFSGTLLQTTTKSPHMSDGEHHPEDACPETCHSELEGLIGDLQQQVDSELKESEAELHGKMEVFFNKEGQAWDSLMTKVAALQDALQAKEDDVLAKILKLQTTTSLEVKALCDQVWSDTTSFFDDEMKAMHTEEHNYMVMFKAMVHNKEQGCMRVMDAKENAKHAGHNAKQAAIAQEEWTAKEAKLQE